MLRLRTTRFFGILLICVMLALMFAGLPRTVKAAATIYVPDNYTTIQAAVNAAGPGDTIIVRNDTYTENVNVSKPLTIKSQNGAEVVTIQGVNPSSQVISIYANYVEINGFTVKKTRRDVSSIGIGPGSSNCHILNNNAEGICILNSNNNIISNNYFSNSWAGIYLDNANANSIYMNNFINNDSNFCVVKSVNVWNSPLKITYSYNGQTFSNYLGNYWSNYSGSDANGDGIGDTPYNIDSDKDNYPLMKPFENYAPDSFADLGNAEDEAQHNLVGWGNAQGPPDNPYVSPSGDRTKRYQILRGDNSVDLGINNLGIDYLLTTEVEDGGCTDNFEIYVNGKGPIYQYQGSHPGSGEAKIHKVVVPKYYITANHVTVTFRNTSTDDCGLAAVYNVKLQPHILIDIIPPTVTVMQPNGGESWPACSTQNILWIANDNLPGNLNYLLEYSTDGGINYTYIANLTNQPQGTIGYVWVVPVINVCSQYYRVKVTATDSAGNSASDCSDANFTIITATGLYIPHWVNVQMNDGSVIRMDLDEYVIGVVAGEMYSNWEIEALKAQAVAARNVALKNYHHNHLDVDVCANPNCCQAWKPPPYSQSVEQAVSSTHNQIITFGGKIAKDVMYFKHCNGSTRNSEDYDGLVFCPYLRSVICGCVYPHYDGHGVGMCQYGAEAMAEKDSSYIDILKHYYTGVEITTANTTENAHPVAEAATGTGKVYLATDEGIINGFVPLASITYNTKGRPNVHFIHGFFAYTITGINPPGSTVTITMTLPSPIPKGAQYWKYSATRGWENVTSLLGDDDGDNVLTLDLTDGSMVDADGMANGTIVDPGGPAIPIQAVPTPTNSRASPAPSRLLNLAQMSIQYLNINPQQTYAGQQVTITTNVVNTGDEAGNYNVALKINGRVEQQRMISVGPHGTQPVKFTATRSQPGTYTVDIGEQRGSFIVLGTDNKASGSNKGGGLLVILIFGILAATIVVVVMLARQRI